MLKKESPERSVGVLVQVAVGRSAIIVRAENLDLHVESHKKKPLITLGNENASK